MDDEPADLFDDNDSGELPRKSRRLMYEQKVARVFCLF